MGTDVFPGMVIGIFDEPLAAEQAVGALTDAGFSAESVPLNAASARAVAALTGSSEQDWREHFAESGGWLVLVAEDTRTESVDRLLRAEGAREVVTSRPLAVPAEPAATPSAGVKPGAIQPGMTVMSSDKLEVGRVKRVGETAVLVDRAMRPDLWVPLSSVDRVIESWVVLKLPFARVDLAASFLLEH
jgi:hypothetical protein